MAKQFSLEAIVNKELQDYARTKIKEGLSRCTDKEQHLFKRMYSHENLQADINDVVDNMPEEILDWAMYQVAKTLRDRESK